LTTYFGATTINADNYFKSRKPGQNLKTIEKKVWRQESRLN